MLNSDNNVVDKDQNIESCTIPVILLTQNAVAPIYQSPRHLKAIFPEKISNEIIVVHYSLDDDIGADVRLVEGSSNSDVQYLLLRFS